MNLALIAQAASPGASGFLGFLPFILIMVVVYFLMLRPQMKKQKQHAKMAAELRKGDDVVTAGGLHGRIVYAGEKDSTVQVQVAHGVVVTVERVSIARKIGSGEEVAAGESVQREVKIQKTNGGQTRKEIWGKQPAGSAVVTSSSRASSDGGRGGSNTAGEDQGYRKGRHRRFRKRRPSYQGPRETPPEPTTTPEQPE